MAKTEPLVVFTLEEFLGTLSDLEFWNFYVEANNANPNEIKANINGTLYSITDLNLIINN